MKRIKKETEEDSRRWKDFPCSQIGRISSMKMAILLKEIYRFNEILSKVLMAFFIKREKS
jgi:hypothetical protein